VKAWRTPLTEENVKARLLEKGLQPTLQRVLLCQYLLGEAEHPSAEDVYSWTQVYHPSISLATVYNTLGMMVDSGLLKEYKLSHTDKVIYDNNLEDHYHFLDEESGLLYDIPVSEISLTGPSQESFQIDRTDVLFKGKYRPNNNNNKGEKK